MGIKTYFSGACFIASCLASSYFAYNFGKGKNQLHYQNKIDNYLEKINQSEDKIKNIISNLPSKYYIIKGKAEEMLGGGQKGAKELKIFALNIANEANSSLLHSSKFRTHEGESAAVAYSVLNRFKNGNYSSLEEVIYEKNQYSWTKGNLQTVNENDESYIKAVEIASYIIVGSEKYERYNFGQTHYCKPYYYINNVLKFGCQWHNKSKNLLPLGRIHFDSETPKSLIKDSDLSAHNFYTLKD